MSGTWAEEHAAASSTEKGASLAAGQEKQGERRRNRGREMSTGKRAEIWKSVSTEAYFPAPSMPVDLRPWIERNYLALNEMDE